MPLKATVKYPRIDIKRSVEEIHGVMVDAVIEAAKTFVIHSTDLVPVYSGASKASFLRLAALTRTQLIINPVAPSRIPLGVATSTGELLVEKGKSYGFEWSSDLVYIHIVDQRYGFIDAGVNALANFQPPVLPSPVIRRS